MPFHKLFKIHCAVILTKQLALSVYFEFSIFQKLTKTSPFCNLFTERPSLVQYALLAVKLRTARALQYQAARSTDDSTHTMKPLADCIGNL